MNRATKWWMSFCLVLLAVFGGAMPQLAALAYDTAYLSCSGTFIYDADRQTGKGYDNNAVLGFAYGGSSVLAPDEKKTGVWKQRGPLVRFAESLAAETGATKLLTAGTDVPNAGGVIRSFAQEGDQIYYRVFSGSQQGRFLTAVPPGSSAFAREALALPPGNQATLIQEVLVPNGTILQRSRALPAFGARGGAEQFELLQKIPNGNFGPGTPLP